MMQFRSQRAARRGFTFLEIMFVVVIIGILLALVGPKLVGQTQKARITTTSAQMSNLETSLKNYEMHMGSFPKSLNGLIENEENKSAWDGPYLDKDAIPKDAWENDYNYKFPGDNNRRGFDLWSNGPNGTDDRGEDDDIANWTVKK